MTTVQEFIDSGDSYFWYCRNPDCDHSAKLDMLRFRERFGPDHGCLAPEIIPRLHCTECGGNEIGLTRQPKGDEDRQSTPPINAYLKARGG